jgi:hypothetical protein
MTQARQVTAGRTVMVTRRALRRHYLFRPDPKMNQLCLYALGVAAKRHNILVHDFVMMSTHEHGNFTDVEGELPRFMHCMHRAIALGTKVLRKWEGQVWDGREPSVVELDTLQAMVEKSAYVQANPVTAGAVKNPAQWPGVRLSAAEMGETVITVRKPDFYFDQDNDDWPEEVTIGLTLPRQLVAHYGSEERAAAAIKEEQARQVENAHAKAKKCKWRFFGAHRVAMMSPYKRATSYEPLRDRNPTFAVGKGNREAFFVAVSKLRDFRRSYREALIQWCAGVRDVVFPFGTWQMAVHHGAAVAPGPAG